MLRIRWWVLLIAAAGGLWPAAADAHEVPARVHVNGLIRPDSDRLRVLVRVPLNSMRDMDFPLYGPGFVDIARAGPVLRDAALLWVAGSMRLYENDQPLAGVRVAAARVSLPSDLSFGTWADALAHTQSPADTLEQLPWEQAMLDVLLEYPITAETARFAIDPLFAHLGMRTTTELRFVPESGAARTYTFSGNPGLLRLNPAWHHTTSRFMRHGAGAVVGSLQLLLLLACVLIGFRRPDEFRAVWLPFAVGSILPIVAGGTGLLPDTLWITTAVDFLVAAGILYLALETIFGASVDRRARAAFVTGLIAGTSLWYSLQASLQFAAGQDLIAIPLFAFGAQAAIAFAAAAAAILIAVLLPRIAAGRVATIVLCAIIAHTALHWAIDRGTALRAYDVSFSLGAYSGLQLARAVMLIALFVVIASLCYVAARRLAPAGVRAGVFSSGGD